MHLDTLVTKILEMTVTYSSVCNHRTWKNRHYSADIIIHSNITCVSIHCSGY